MNKYLGNPYMQMTAGGHTVGIIKDGELIATDAEVFEHWLESKEFYEVCQQYRHAPDVLRVAGHPNAADAYEILKAYIRERIG